jgi:two-component system osmolarity sensor histidine kinase EnvZ
VRTFLLVSLLLFVCVVAWLTLFALAEREPHARQLAQLTVSVVNLTRAALISADPVKRHGLLRELSEREGVRLYPAETSDLVEALPEERFFQIMSVTALSQLGPRTRFALSVNGQAGIWASFSIDGEGGDEASNEASADNETDFWVMLPSQRAEYKIPWHWLVWGGASLALALLVAWLIVSRVTRPLRALARAAGEVGHGRHPPHLPENGACELQQLASAFNRMSEDLQRIDRERAEVLAGISHDLRTPLARLRLEAEMSISDSTARDAVNADIEQMDSIIAQFLGYARGEGGEKPVLTDINSMIRRAATRLERLNLAVGLKLEHMPPILVYPKALARALDNLLENAHKYAGTKIEIETHLENRNKKIIVIDVLDRGPGIPESETARMKRPFTRLENARTNACGTGLGLAIVERIARLHDGQLELLPRDGGGLIARLKLPLVS